MHRRLASSRPFALGWTLVFLAAACASGPATWTFQPTPEATAQPSGSPTASGSPAASASPVPSGSAAASGGTTGCSADATVIKIEETAALQMVPATVDATAGKKVCFQVTNTAGFTHNFYVGPATDIETRNKTDAVAGTPDFSSGTQTLEYTFAGSGPFEYACWIPGHLEAGMKGSVTLK
jgi:uncharacterized cupredoxin-like copper-binding protein